MHKLSSSSNYSGLALKAIVLNVLRFQNKSLSKLTKHPHISFWLKTCFLAKKKKKSLVAWIWTCFLFVIQKHATSKRRMTTKKDVRKEIRRRWKMVAWRNYIRPSLCDKFHDIISYVSLNINLFLLCWTLKWTRNKKFYHSEEQKVMNLVNYRRHLVHLNNRCSSSKLLPKLFGSITQFNTWT
jgi:hypothetical protein